MSHQKRKTFSSAREVFKTYLPKSTQEERVNSGYGQIEDSRTSELLEGFKSSLKRQARR
jgi:hypothetical protein